MLTGERRRSWAPHWPLALLTVGYPLWWLLGVASFMPVVVAVLMGLQLYRARGSVRLVAGMRWWVAFLVWVALSCLVLSADAPGAVDDDASFGRLLVWGYGFVTYLACTVAMVWIANQDREQVPFTTVARQLGWLYLWSTLGGLLGLVAPHLELSSLMELVLPRALRSNGFVRSLIHPAVADIQTILGHAETRPKAPFPYSNTWGSVTALSLPFFVLGWLFHGRAWQRLLSVPVLVVSAAPIVYSLNRGLWGCLAVGVLLTAVALARRGRYAALIATAVVVLVGAVALVASPLGDLVGQRFDNQHSNDRREQLMFQTVQSAAVGSPVVGFGSTRDVQGSFASIAGGSTPDCPACGVPPLGTQGHLWLVIFAQGLVGAAFFLLFLGQSLVRTAPGRSPPELVASMVLVFFFIQLLIYDTLGLPLLIVLLAIGLAWRENPAGETLRELLSPLLRERSRILAMTLIGLVAGLAATLIPPDRYEATAHVLLIDTPSYLPVALAERAPRPITIDTEAALVVSERTLAAVAPTPAGQAALRDRLRISAVPTTRVLVIELAGNDRVGLMDTLDEVTTAYLQTRHQYLRTRQQSVLSVLYGRLAELESDPLNESADRAAILTAIDDNLRTPTISGEVIRGGESSALPRSWAVYATSGIAVALVLSGGRAWATRRANRRPI